MGARVIVVGGGVIGVCAAYRLADRGADVMLVERDRLAAGASFGNAGTVSAGHPPLNKPGRVKSGLTQLADPTGPLYVKPRWDPGLWAWMADFARYCTEEHVFACMEIMGPLGREALRMFDDVVEREGLACGYRHDGYFAVCRTESGLADAAHEADIIRAYGYHPEKLDTRAMLAAEPTLAADVLGAIFYPEAATLDPYAFVTGLADAAAAQGVESRVGADVEDVVVEGGRTTGVRLRGGERIDADAVVLATGPFSLELASRLGVRLPVQPGKGYHRDLAVGPGASPPLRVAFVLHEVSVFCTP